MPELPEIEVLRRSLEPRLVGRRVEGVRVHNGALREPVSDTDLARGLVGRRVVSMRRRAKYLLGDVSGDVTLVVHLGMSGRLTLLPASTPLEPHEHVSIALDGDERLAFRDPRRFGLVLALPSGSLDEDRHFRRLGLEPLGDELTGARLRALAGGRRGPVKSFLMNGNLVVGVGNIYASEALFHAGIHPRRSVARIGRGRWDELASAIRRVLGRAIDEGGTTLNDFRDAEGREGYFRVSLEVYGRAGEPCRRCGRPIRRIVQTGRSTFYCPGCQR